MRPITALWASMLAFLSFGCRGERGSPERCTLCETNPARCDEAEDAGEEQENDCIRVVATYEGSSELSISVDWSPTDDYVLSGAIDELRLLRVDAQGGTLSGVNVFLQPGRSYVKWSPDGTHALSVSADVRLLAVARAPGAISPVAVYSGHVGDVYAVAWSRDGTLALTAGEDGTVRLLGVSVAGGSLSELAVFQGHSGKVYAVAWAPDGAHAVTAGQDGTARLLAVDAAVPALEEVTRLFWDEWASLIAWSPVRDEVLTGTWGACNAVQLWAVAVGSGVFTGHDGFHRHASGVRALEWRFDGDYALTGGHDDTVHLFAVERGPAAPRRLATLRDNRAGVHAVSWSPTGEHVVLAASKTDRLTLLDVRSCFGP